MIKITTKLIIGDCVRVISGNNRGKIGNIISILCNEYICINGVVLRDRYIRSFGSPNREKKKIPCKMHISNVMLFKSYKDHAGDEKYLCYRSHWRFINGKKVRCFPNCVKDFVSNNNV